MWVRSEVLISFTERFDCCIWVSGYILLIQWSYHGQDSHSCCHPRCTILSDLIGSCKAIATACLQAKAVGEGEKFFVWGWTSRLNPVDTEKSHAIKQALRAKLLQQEKRLTVQLVKLTKLRMLRYGKMLYRISGAIDQIQLPEQYFEACTTAYSRRSVILRPLAEFFDVMVAAKSASPWIFKTLGEYQGWQQLG